MRRAILQLALGVTAIALALFGSYAFASDSVYVGEERIAHVVYCRDLKDAEDIAKAYASGGHVAADAVLATKAGEFVTSGVCAGRVAGFRVRRLASSHGEGDNKMNVIEVEDLAGSGIYYVVNSTLVAEPAKGTNGLPLKLKPERNA